MSTFQLLIVDADDALFAPMCAWFAANHTPEWVSVGSAGTNAPDGGPVGPKAIEISSSLGFDLKSHKTTTATPALVGAADLVITRCWENVSALMPAAPDRANEMFTIKEWLHWARTTPLGKQNVAPGAQRARQRVEAVHVTRRKARAEHGFWAGLASSDIDFPVPDPAREQTWPIWLNALRTVVTDAVALLEGAPLGAER